MSKIFKKTIETALALFDPPKHQPRCFVCRCIFDGNKLVSVGINSLKSNPKNLYNPLYCRHTGRQINKNGSCAELAAAIKLKNRTNIDFKKTTFVNVRLMRNGQIGNAKPCSSCFSLIQYLRPKSLFYTDFDGEFKAFQI